MPNELWSIWTYFYLHKSYTAPKCGLQTSIIPKKERVTQYQYGLSYVPLESALSLKLIIIKDRQHYIK